MMIHEIKDICSICHIAWKKGLMDGWSGNASIRTGENILITAKGTPKGFLTEKNCILIDKDGNLLEGEGSPSSESALHLALYAARPDLQAILHTHPIALQALEEKLACSKNKNKFLKINLFEAQIWRERLFMTDAAEPGSGKVGQNAAKALPFDTSLPCAVWLGKHGIAAAGMTLLDCFCLTEELEHLARVQLLANFPPPGNI